MMSRNLLKSIFIFAAILLSIGSASAYHYKTHALSAKLAAELVKRLDAAKKLYAEIYEPSHIIQLGTGAWEEDNGNFAGNNRAMRHYYNPDCKDKKKGVPYYKHYTWWRTLEEGTDVTKPSGGRYAGALEWARNGAVDNWSNANPFNWEGAIRAYDYTHSSRSEAYYRLGHVLHLLTDMAEPDHALNMPHAGSSKGLPDTIDEIIGKSMADAIMSDIKKMRVTEESKKKIAWLLFATKIKQRAFKSRRLGYELLVDDCIHPKFVEEFFKGKNEIHLIKSDTTWDTLPPIQGKHLPGLHEIDDFFNSLARWSKLAVSDRKKYPIPLGIEELGNYFILKEYIYPGEPIYLIPAIDMNNEAEKQKYYSLAWELLEKATEYNAELLKHFHDIVNPPPYVKKVIVSQDGNVMYSAYWKDIHDLSQGSLRSKDPHQNYQIVKKRELKPQENKKLTDGKTASIKIIFGPDFIYPEKIDKGSVKVTIDGKHVQGSIKSDEAPNVWEGTFPVPKLKENEDEKTLQISISASDADRHWTVGPIPGGYTLDSDPYTPAKVYYDGPGRIRWMNHESLKKSDTFHKITVVKEKKEEKSKPKEEEKTDAVGGECPIPEGATKYEREKSLYFEIDGHKVGPRKEWFDEDRKRPSLEECYNKEGKLHGIRRKWFSNDKLMEESQWKDGKRDGPCIRYYNTGKPKNYYVYKNDVMNGMHRRWYQNGQIRVEGMLVDGKRQGAWKQWWDNGKPWSVTPFVDDRAHGTQLLYNTKGQLKGKKEYRNGELIK